jgi:multiple antibiotic resistance protein
LVLFALVTSLFTGIITLFVILDPVGVLPFFISLTQGASPPQRKKLAKRAVLIAMGLLLVFAFLGDAILLFLGIQIADFEVAGGALLLIFALRDALSSEPLGMTEATVSIKETKIVEALAVIPIATPLLAGPGSLTVVMLLSNSGTLGIVAATIAILVDCSIAWILFRLSDRITKAASPTLLLIVGKVMDILMAAIAVSFLTTGITTIFGAIH